MAVLVWDARIPTTHSPARSPPAAKAATKPSDKGHALVASLKKGKLAAEKRNRELEQENAALLRDNKRMKAMIVASMGDA